MTGQTNGLELSLRAGLPDALRILLEEYPRHGWVGHPSYQGLISFWLDRHMMFRRLLEKLKGNVVACLDGEMEAKHHAVQLARFGSMFVGELHTHHNIEDMHYFPILVQKDARIATAFDLLDKDHQALHELLDRFVEQANDVLQRSEDQKGALGRFIDEVDGLERLVDRHLIDEEETVVPVVLKFGAGGLE